MHALQSIIKSCQSVFGTANSTSSDMDALNGKSDLELARMGLNRAQLMHTKFSGLYYA